MPVSKNGKKVKNNDIYVFLGVYTRKNAMFDIFNTSYH